VSRHRVAVLGRFVLVNVLNTGLYWGLYLLLLLVSPYLVANTVALVVAVLAAYVANARWAFAVAPSRGSLLRYLVANGTTILVRTAVVWLLVTPLSLPEQLAPPVAVAGTMPVAFVLTTWAMAERSVAAREQPSPVSPVAARAA
jgi:putative flippase GtrA